MGSDDLGQRVAVAETKIETLQRDVADLKEQKRKLPLQDLLILVSVLGTLIALIAKGLGWTP
jgi:hypothetical protein